MAQKKPKDPTKRKPKAPKEQDLESREFPKLLQRALGQAGMEYQRAVNQIVQEAVEDLDLQDGGWQVDLQNGRFVRPKPKSAE